MLLQTFLISSHFFLSPCTLEVGEVVPETPTLPLNWFMEHYHKNGHLI